jgi:ABC-2 type transport system ATP-binding protein
MENIIDVKELTKRFGDFTALDEISFKVKNGEVFGFLGPNGAGKTTTIRILTGLSKPTSGNASILGFDIRSEIINIKKLIGVVPEISNLYDELSGLTTCYLWHSSMAFPSLNEEKQRKNY